MDFVIVLVILFVVVLVITAPLRIARARPGSAASDLADLEAEREAKYREIRDAELDHRTGKLSDSDYELLDGTLRSEAVEIMRSIDTIEQR